MRKPFLFVGVRPERKHQRFDPAVLYKRQQFWEHYGRGC